MAAAFIGLWLGERGRRRDIQWLTGLRTPKGQPEMRVSYPDDVPGAGIMTAEARERYVDDTMKIVERQYGHRLDREDVYAEADEIAALAARMHGISME